MTTATKRAKSPREIPVRKAEGAEVILKELLDIHAQMLAGTATPGKLIDGLHPAYKESAKNLVEYLELRRHDLRPLQAKLAAMGLSSLGRSESCALATVEAVIEALRRFVGKAPKVEPARDFTAGERLLKEHTDALLGPAPAGRATRIMVTMPTEAGHEYSLVHDLLQHGMNCMRINCAHDGPAEWTGMIENLRRAEKAVGKTCRVVMDLAGPKLRTGPMEAGPAVVRIRPERDVFGQVTMPARVWLTDEEHPQEAPSDAAVALPVPAKWLSRLKAGVGIEFEDTRGSKREWTVLDVTQAGCWASSVKTCYVVPGTILRIDGDKGSEAVVKQVPAQSGAIELVGGDLLIVTRDLAPGRAATKDSSGAVLTPAHIGCTIPEVLQNARPGQPIWFDDGAIGAVVEKQEAEHIVVRITHTHVGGGKLRADKGINLPETDFTLDALTDKDVEDLAFASQHADIVELSFANTVKDVQRLQQYLVEAGERRPGIVLKIETRRGFENLPAMLLAAMRWPVCGIMIARGDLAVECGFERMAEVQEEILWICEAAHVPVIWATQVLESLAKEGIPSRAEITDAAMGDRAECVMLNKGPYVVRAVEALDDILRRMQTHQAKKRAMLRRLKLAGPKLAPASENVH